MKPTLLILAAGLGARYGGLKQIDSVGPNGEIIIDYSIYDAINAGFDKVVFVIRHYFESAFREKIGNKCDNLVETAYAYQELDACLDGFKPREDPNVSPKGPLPKCGQGPFGRDKPWGTGHAVLVAKDVIDEPFAVINADDYYGINSLKMMAEFLRGPKISPTDYAMVGFRLGNTLSEYGAVSRGVCHCRKARVRLSEAAPSGLHPCDDELFLLDVVERKRVEKHGNAACYFDDDGTEHMLTGDEVVSMNLWGFHASIFGCLSQEFKDFLEEHGNELKSELFIPSVVDELVESGRVNVKVLPTRDNWFGVTYRDDREIAERSIAGLISDGTYPEKLWEK